MSKAGYAKCAIEGDPIMAFWTVAACLFLYVPNPSVIIGLLLFLSTFTSSVTFIEIDRYKEVIQGSNKASRRRGGSNRSKRRQAHDILSDNVFDQGLRPGHIIMTANLLVGIGLLAYLSYLHIIVGRGSLILVALLILPLMWLFSILWRLYQLVS